MWASVDVGIPVQKPECGLANSKLPPQPEIYTFSHVSTRNATGEILECNGSIDPYTVDIKSFAKLLSIFITNWVELALTYVPAVTGNVPPIDCPIT